MRFLITGANGFLGSWLTRALVSRGDDVRCLVRRGSDASALSGVNATLVEGDVTEEKSLRAALEGVEVCVHLAGIRRSPRREEFMRVNAGGTENVAQAMLISGARRLVLCSSLAASGPAGAARPRVETDPFCPEEWYGESKAEAERLAFAHGDRLEVTAIRPCRIIGPGDRENLTFFTLAKKGWILKIGGEERLYSMVDVDDVVAQVLLQSDLKEAVGEAFFSGADETTTVEALMRVVAEALQVKTRTLYVPEVVLGAIGEVANVVSSATGKKLPISRKMARQLLAPGWVCSIEKAKSLLGYRPKVTLRDSVIRSAKAYQAAGWL